MNRLGEKVRDIVEVRSSPNLKDFLLDPFATVEGYHFTDITSDLMAKWLDHATTAKKGAGTAMALAGFRGVGKSHFLAVLGALISQPDCRGRLIDAHVAAAVQRLSRRPGVVAHVRRGSESTLLDEFRTAIAEATKTRGGELGSSVNELMLRASARSLDLPLVVLVDTASDRQSRVDRDDGPLLSEIAEAAKEYGAFLGLALDDDIAGADGMNSSIASSFSIDYLDQEHLYQVVNGYLFAKRDQMRPVLHDIYEDYRKAFPSFRWSEHRFLSLYPLHPAILEIAPFIRLYLQDFALLGFASDAGLKILGRPANSLIGLDEVFDAVEARLRSVPEIAAGFQTYDQLDREVIAKMPVMKRLPAKLVLKGLFILSIKDESVGADELRSAMLIEGDSVEDIAATIGSFVEHLPESILSTTGTDGVERFRVKLNEKDDLRSALDVEEAELPNNVLVVTLQRQFFEKFSEHRPSDGDGSSDISAEIVWRGGIRRGRVVWNGSPPGEGISADLDWTVTIGNSREAERWWPVDPKKEFFWKLADLTPSELDTARRLNQLLTDEEIREKHRDSLASAIHSHSIAMEKLWQRAFLEDAVLVHDGREFPFPADAESAHTLAELLHDILRPAFELAYPEHPRYGRTLEEKDALLVTKSIYRGPLNLTADDEVRARDIALPLGLIRSENGVYYAVSDSELADLPVIRDTVLKLGSDTMETLSLGAVRDSMAAAPFGLTRESCHLLLSALVAQKHFEFVTSSGNRIHYRSLDLQIDWQDITGIARPAAQTYTDDQLIKWAARLTGDEGLTGDRSPEARARAVTALGEWLTDWKCSAVLARFDTLPDANLNSSLWRLANSVRKSFGIVAEHIEGMVDERGSLDTCLQNIADTFSDSEREFDQKLADLRVLESTLNILPDLERLRSYVVDAEPTGNAPTDRLRAKLIEALAVLTPRDAVAASELMEMGAAFSREFAEQYIARHSAALDGQSAKSRLDEFLRSDLWTLFTSLSVLPVFDKHDLETALDTIRAIKRVECEADVNAVLEVQPLCVCGFRLGSGSEADHLISKLSSTVATTLKRVSQLLVANRMLLSSTVDEDVLNSFDDAVNGRGGIPKVTANQVRLLKTATLDLAVTHDHIFIDPHPFESLSDALLENELGRMESIT